MKVKKDYILKTVAGQHIVVPIGKAASEFHGMITLNDTGKFLFECLKDHVTLDYLVEKLLETYDVTKDRATHDVDKFIALLTQHHILED